MQTSEQIDQIGAALALAQAKIVGAVKDSANPFFRSKYADLASVWDAVREPLTENGLAVVQTTGASETGVNITTMLLHKSGQWIRDTLTLLPKESTPQGVGSAITYGRRYGLAAITGCPQIDDDGNAASGRGITAPGGTSFHDPKGELGKGVPEDVAIALADRIREIATPEAAAALQVEHRSAPDSDEKHQEFTAAWRLIDSKGRSRFNKLLTEAKANAIRN